MGGQTSLAFALVIVAVAVVVTVQGDASADPAPMEALPSGDGPYSVGYYYDDVQTSTKSYSVGVRVHYPATRHGQGTDPDGSGAPYPGVIWLPGFGGSRDSYNSWTGRLSSWGFVVMSVSVNWHDWPNSANIADVEDYLDYLEDENATGGTLLEGLLDSSAYGLSGHSSGGGLSLVDGAYVDRITAVHTFAAAIGSTAVDGIAQDFEKPLMLQVGEEDSQYIQGSRRSYAKIGPPNNLVITDNAGHGGPYQMGLWHAFYLHHLSGRSGYRPLLYGNQAVQDFANGDYNLKFKLSDAVYFPPKVHASVSATEVAVGEGVNYTGAVVGFFPRGIPELRLEWDLDDDGSPEAVSSTETNVTHSFHQMGNYTATFTLAVGRYVDVAPEDITVSVVNMPPVAVAGDDLTVDHDSEALLDAGSSYDSPVDLDLLTFRWDFGDGHARDFAPDPRAAHTYVQVGAFTATLTVRDPHGAEAVDTLEVTVVNVVPVAEAGVDLSALEDEPARLSGQGNDTPSHRAELRFQWDFGDGISTGWTFLEEAWHSYTASGTYNATFMVKDPEGEVASDHVEVTVENVVPTAEMLSPRASDRPYEDDELDFRGSGHDTPSDLDDLVFMWEFGDGNSTDWGPLEYLATTHTYTQSGDRTVTLRVRDDDGEVGEVRVTIAVRNRPPVATLEGIGSPIDALEDTEVTLAGSAEDTPSDRAGLTFQWHVEEVVFPGRVVAYSFAKAGHYQTVFRVTDDDGAASEVTVWVHVANVGPQATADLDRRTIEEGEGVNYTASVEDTPSDMETLATVWTFGDGTTSSELSGHHVFAEPGTYTVTFSVRDDDGEEASVSFTVVVTERVGPPQPSEPIDTGGGDGFPVSVAVAAAAVAAVLVAVTVLLVMRGRSTWRPGPQREGQETGEDPEEPDRTP